MTEPEHDALAKFVENIVRNLEKNGFPGRRVSFPLERMYESAYEKGLSFNKVLEVLEERGIAHEKTTEKVVFLRVEDVVTIPQGHPLADLDFRALEGLSPEDMVARVASVVQQMSPEQLAAIEGLVANLTEEQKADLVDRARKLGIA